MISCNPQQPFSSLYLLLPARRQMRGVGPLPAGWRQNNSIKEYQGIYELIKDCTSLSRIENGENEHRVTTWVVTENQVHENSAQP